MDKYINEDNYNEDYNEKAIKLRYFLEQHASIANMGEIVVSSTEKPIIGTTALDTCFGIVFYDRKNKKGIVGHAYDSGKIAIMNDMIGHLEKNDDQVIEYAIVSGYRNVERKDYSGETELLNYLQENCPKNIKLIPFNGLNIKVCSNVLAYEFAFEVNAGTDVSNYLFYDEFESLKKYR